LSRQAINNILSWIVFYLLNSLTLKRAEPFANDANLCQNNGNLK